MSSIPADIFGDGSEAAQRLERSFRAWDDKSKTYQRRRLTFVKFVIFIGPAAVALNAAQSIIFPEMSFGALLILTQVVILAFALCIPLLKLGRDHQRWIVSRVRSQILRREQYLLFARVGPYLNLTTSQADGQVTRRLASLDQDFGEPITLLSPSHSLSSWRDALEEQGPGADTGVAGIADRATQYVANRVADQRGWFITKKHDHERQSRRLENRARFILTVALVFAAIHLGMLFKAHFVDHVPLQVDTILPKGVLLLAACLPAVGSAYVAYKSALGSERQAWSYDYYATAIEPLEMSLRALSDTTRDQQSRHDSLHFKRLVLDVELLLTDELRQWWMNMAIKRPQVNV